MQLGKLVQPEKFPIFSHMLASPLWNREAEHFSPIDLDTLFATVRRKHGINDSQRACDVVVLKLKTAEVAGKIGAIRVQHKNYVRPLITKTVFEEKMAQLSDVRRDCLMLALEMNWTINQAVGLERHEVKLYQFEINERAWAIIDRQTPSMAKKTVFWEDVRGEHRMLISLTHQFSQVFRMEWQELLRQYDRATGQFCEGVTKEEALQAILQR